MLTLWTHAGQAQTGAFELQAPELAGTSHEDVPASLKGQLESGLGQGSFIADEYARNPYFAWAASFVGSYYPRKGSTLSVYAKLMQELSDSDVDSEQRQFLWSDVQLRARQALGIIPRIDTRAQVEGRLYLPSSLVSRYETLRLGTLLRFVLSREFGRWSLGLFGSFRKNFHEYTSPAIDDPARDPASDSPWGELSSVYARSGGPENLPGSTVAIAGNNVSFSLSGLLSVSYAPLDKLSLGVYYGLGRAYAYRRYPRDENTSPYADPGRGKRDSAVAGFDVEYHLNERFAFNAGVSTASTPKTEDNQSFRFPFYDFQSTAANLTMFYLVATVTQLLGG